MAIFKIRPLLGILVIATLLGGCGDGSSDHDSEDSPPKARSHVQESRADFFKLYRAASRAKKSGDYQEAVRIYRQALGINPKHEASLVDLSHSLRLLGKNQEACKTLEQLRKFYPKLPRPSFLLADLLSQDGAPINDLKRASSLYEEVLAIEPNIAGPRLGLARVQKMLGLMKEAESSYQLVLGTDSRSLEALIGLADIHIARQRPAQAVPLLVRALKIGTRAQGRRDVPSEMDTSRSFDTDDIESGKNRHAWLSLARCAQALGGYPATVPTRFRHPDPASVVPRGRSKD